MTYKLTHTGCIIRLEDNTCIPPDLANSDYIAYQAWETAGNMPLPADPLPNPLIAQAQAALSGSDVVMLRCVENGLAVPAAWTTYRKTLRAIANGSDTTSTALPEKPVYPAGT